MPQLLLPTLRRQPRNTLAVLPMVAIASLILLSFASTTAPHILRSSPPTSVGRRNLMNAAAGLAFACGLQQRGEALASGREGGGVTFVSQAKSPVMCTKPKRGMERKKGVVNINDEATFDKAECDLGGYTTKTRYSLNTPDSFRPFTGYFKGGPDNSGLLDLRLQSQDYGQDPVTIFVRSYRYKPDGSLMDKKNAPWVDKTTITDLGTPEAFLKVLASNLAVDETVSSSETVDGVTYYRYQLFKNEKGYANNRKIISAAVVDGDLLTAVGLASEPSWEAAKSDLLEAVNSFRVTPGTGSPPQVAV